MPDVSAAIIVLAGAVLVIAGAVASSLTDTSRQRVVGLGYLLAAVGAVAWLIAYVPALIRISRSIP